MTKTTQNVDEGHKPTSNEENAVTTSETISLEDRLKSSFKPVKKSVGSLPTSDHSFVEINLRTNYFYVNNAVLRATSKDRKALIIKREKSLPVVDYKVPQEQIDRFKEQLRTSIATYKEFLTFEIAPLFIGIDSIKADVDHDLAQMLDIDDWGGLDSSFGKTLQRAIALKSTLFIANTLNIPAELLIHNASKDFTVSEIQEILKGTK